MSGSAISWNSRPIVAVSTKEAEYMSMAAALQESQWERALS